jgi:hypothetical protein
MPRFTISRHTGSREGDHYDLMLELGDGLRTWRLANTAFQTAQVARQIPDHKPLYLDYEGEISGDRGQVKIWDTGTYTADAWKEDRIQVALVGRSTRTRILLTLGPRHPEDSEARWSVVDAAQEIRKAASALLREAVLEDAPTPELGDLRASLAREERKIMSLVDQYTRGGAVDWGHVGIDPDLRKRLEKEKARWQHPWLAAAKSYADKLANLATLVHRHDPASKKH